MAIENLTTYIEVDSGSDITVTAPSASFVAMPREVVSYVYKDFGAGYFTDFDIDFEFQITAMSTTGVASIFSVSNTIGTFQDQITAGDGLRVVAYGNTNNFQIQIRDENIVAGDVYTYGGTSTPLLYCTVKRNGTTFTLDVYSDSGRTSLLDTLTITCETGAKRYLSVAQAVVHYQVLQVAQVLVRQAQAVVHYQVLQVAQVLVRQAQAVVHYQALVLQVPVHLVVLLPVLQVLAQIVLLILLMGLVVVNQIHLFLH